VENSSWPRAAAKKALLHLHAALDATQFWSATQELLRDAIPSSSSLLCLRAIRGTKPMLVLRSSETARALRGRQRHDVFPVDGEEPRLATRSLQLEPLPADFFTIHPALSHFRSNPGLATVRLGDLLADQTPAARAKFERRLARPLGWRTGAAAAFWRHEQLEGVLLLHRNGAVEFSDREMELLRQMQPDLETALRRVIAVRRQQARGDCLGRVLQPLPLPVVLCDSRLNVIYENHAGLEARAAWLMGSDEARAVNISRELPLPDDLADYCRRRMTAWEEKLPTSKALPEVVTAEMEHPAAKDARVRISMIKRKAFPLIKPMFLLEFGQGAEENAAHQTDGAHFAELSRLSPRERELAGLVCDGYTNKEISAQLGKSVRTIKTQMHSIFGKLRVSSRGKLISMLCRIVIVGFVALYGIQLYRAHHRHAHHRVAFRPCAICEVGAELRLRSQTSRLLGARDCASAAGAATTKRIVVSGAVPLNNIPHSLHQGAAERPAEFYSGGQDDKFIS
jgi:DNA-binding CsgD family transcriptional regulator/PAS domain-containing protein